MSASASADYSGLIAYVNVKLALLGFPRVAGGDQPAVDDIVTPLVAQYREKERLLANHLCPADQRIQTFLYDYLQDMQVPKLPGRTLVLDRPGMARNAVWTTTALQKRAFVRVRERRARSRSRRIITKYQHGDRGRA